VFEKDATQWLVRDNNKCITCRKCVAACKERQAVNVIGANERGFATLIGSAFDKPLAEIPCIACGQCIVVCPTGALTEKCDIEPVVAALNDPTKYVVIAPAPSIRVALGEEFGMRVGENVEGRMVEALRRLGANAVYDINWAADLTIMEEGHEFIGRLQKHKEGKPVKFPMITSCSPGWIKFIEMYYPEHLEHLSTCKSPQGMFGAIMKSYYAQQNKINLKDLVVVTVMPCTAKKFEAARKELTTKDGYPEVDYVLTTRELARLIKSRGIDFPKLKGDVKKEGKFDQPFGESSTAGLIFGATGGVMEAALRTVVEKITGKPVKPLEVKDVRGPKKGIKEAKYRIPELASKFGIDELKVAVVHGTQNAKTIMEKIKKGEADYHLVEIMACPGGCVTGGGQPIHTAEYMNNHDLRDQRAKAIYATDKKGKVRESHKNKSVEQLYKDFLGEPSGKKAYELLHTKFQKRTKH
ncbi:MAG: [FeFe] hydrogenase, group A, partial [Firmicutes bacterium]|nr:[FeFe] hydrogenase, group A [Bacillota bacterium]